MASNNANMLRAIDAATLKCIRWSAYRHMQLSPAWLGPLTTVGPALLCPLAWYSAHQSPVLTPPVLLQLHGHGDSL